jgi:hypothetical protein
MSSPYADLCVALEQGDVEALRRLLHPYVHWVDRDGTRQRGRASLLERLDDVRRPEGVELRDGQVYRWARRVQQRR